MLAGKERLDMNDWVINDPDLGQCEGVAFDGLALED